MSTRRGESEPGPPNVVRHGVGATVRGRRPSKQLNPGCSVGGVRHKTGVGSLESQLIAAIVEGSDDAIVAKTLDGTVNYWNPGATRIFGYTAAEMIGSPIARIIPAELQAEEAEILAKLALGERIDHYETVRVAKDGHRISVSLALSPLRDAGGAVVGASKIARDISIPRETEDA